MEGLALDAGQRQHGHIDERDDDDAEHHRPDHLLRRIDDRDATFLGVELLALVGARRRVIRRRAFSTTTIAPSTTMPKSSAPRLIRLPDTPPMRMPPIGEQEGGRDDDRHEQRRAPVAKREQQYERRRGSRLR